MTRRAQQAEESRLHLIDTALQIFAERGWEGTSIPEFAKSAGVSQGLLYHYFHNKEELLLAVIERHTFLPQLRELLALSFEFERPAREVLPEVAGNFAALLLEKQKLVQILISEAERNLTISRHLQELIEEGVRLLAGYVESRIKAGELRPHPAALTAHSLLYTIFMARLVQLTDPSFVNAFAQYLLEGILLPGSDSP